MNTGRKRGRLVRRVLFSLLLVGALIYGGLFALVLSGQYTRTTGEPRVMIILGCQVHPWGPSILLQDRLDTALDYLEEHPDTDVIVTGGKGADEPESEAACMRAYLLRAGIGEDRIHMEEQASNTHQNMVYSARMVDELGLDAEDGVLIVSNDFHLTRARMLWRRVTGEGADTLCAPCSHAPSRILMHLREPLALAKSFILDR